MKIYIVNELVQTEETHNYCHGAFDNKEKALELAESILKDAYNDLGGEEVADLNELDNSLSGYAYNEKNNFCISVNIDEVEFEKEN